MKKIRRILAALLLCVMAVSLAGCAELDEMKAQHAVWGEVYKETVEYNGKTYYRLEPSVYLGVWDSKGPVYVTHSDVPALLSKRYGYALTVGASGILLECYEWSGNCPIIYCREDYYESLSRQIQAGPIFSEMLYEYWDEEGNALEYSLAAPEMAAVEALLASVPSQSGIERYALNEDFSFNLERASADGFFRDTLCEVVVEGQKIRLVKDLENDGLVEIYDVPAEQQALFEKMIEKFIAMDWVVDKLNIEQGNLHYSI